MLNYLLLPGQRSPSGIQRTKGLPVLPRGQEQMGLPLSTSHKASDPQGLGWQGFVGGRTTVQPYSALPV